MSLEAAHNNSENDWRKDPELWAIYEKIKCAVTEEEKRNFKIDEPLIPFDEVIAELEGLQQQLKCKEAKG